MSTPTFGRSAGSRSRRSQDGVEAPRNSFESSNARWITAGNEDIPFSIEIRSVSNEVRPKKRRSPNVVARLMGLETFPVEAKEVQNSKARANSYSEKLDHNVAGGGAGVPGKCFLDRKPATAIRLKPRLPDQSRELLDAMEFLQSNKASFLNFLQKPCLLHVESYRANRPTEKTRLVEEGRVIRNEVNYEKTAPLKNEAGKSPSRIVILKPGATKEQKMKPLPSPSCSPRVHASTCNISGKQASSRTIPEKTVHTVTETRIQRQMASRSFVKERLRSSSSKSTKEIAQEIARQARDKASKKMTRPFTSRPLENSSEIAYGSAPTLRRFLNYHQGLESASLPVSPVSRGQKDSSEAQAQRSDKNRLTRSLSERTREAHEESRNGLLTSSSSAGNSSKASNVLNADRQKSSEIPASQKVRRFNCSHAKSEAGSIWFEKPEQPSPVSVLDQQESPSPERQQRLVDASSARSLDFDPVCETNTGKLKDMVLAFPEEGKTEAIYICQLLSASGLAENSDCRFWIQRPILNARLFHALELNYKSQSSLSLYRRQMFDAVNEMLAWKSRHLWKVPGYKLVQSVWDDFRRNIIDLQQAPKAATGGSNSSSSLEGLFHRDVATDAHWEGSDEEHENFGIQLAREMLDWLLEEVVREFLL